MITFEVRHVFLERPAEAQGCVVFNAPRPIPGHKIWIGDFIHGCFYAALDDEGNYYSEKLRRCHELDAVVIAYHDREQEIAKIRAELQEHFDGCKPGLVNVADYEDDVVIRSWLQHCACREVML